MYARQVQRLRIFPEKEFLPRGSPRGGRPVGGFIIANENYFGFRPLPEHIWQSSHEHMGAEHRLQTSHDESYDLSSLSGEYAPRGRSHTRFLVRLRALCIDPFVRDLYLAMK